MYRSGANSCIRIDMGKNDRSAGVAGFPVFALRPGCIGSGRSGSTLYQAVGISFSSSMNFVCSISVLLCGIKLKLADRSFCPPQAGLATTRTLFALRLSLQTKKPFAPKGQKACFRGATLLGPPRCGLPLNMPVYLTTAGTITLPLRRDLLAGDGVRSAAPKSIQTLRRHRLSPSPAL